MDYELDLELLEKQISQWGYMHTPGSWVPKLVDEVKRLRAQVEEFEAQKESHDRWLRQTGWIIP